MDPRHAILFEPVRIGPRTLPNRFYQVPHASGFGTSKRAPRRAPTQRASEVQFGSLAKEMTVADIVRVQRDWAAAAGFDIVYVYGAHGYLVTQFLSPVTNRRTDGYGGTLAGRGRFWLETLEAVRAAAGGECAIATRVAVHGTAGLPGIEADEMLELIAMADHLVDLWDVNVGSWPEDSGTSRYYPEGSQRPWTHRVREATAKPVVAVGRYSSPDLMADVRLDEIRECTGSNICILREEAFRHVGCVQNATAGEEYRRGWHPEMFP